MALGAALATAFVRVRPDTSGFSRELDSQVNREAAPAGAKFGKAFSDGVNRSVKIDPSVQRQLDKLTAGVTRARAAEENAAGAVRVAEQRLADVRANSNAKAVQVAAAEESLARARRAETTATERARLATVDLESARAKAGAEEDKLGQSIRKNSESTSRGLSAMVTAAVALGPALVPVLATATAAAGGLGVALVSGGAALGVFGAVAKASFKDIQDNAKLAKKGTEDLTSPVGRATTAYNGLTAAWEKFVSRNQPATFRIFGAGFSILTQAIPKLQPLFNVAAEAVARFEGQLGHFVAGGGLGRLVGFLTSNARPALESFRQTFTNLFTGIGALSPMFARFAAGVETGMVSLSAKFAAWAQNGGPGGGFQRFINYIVANGPVVAATLHDLASAAVNITQGLAPLGPVSLSFVGAMARLVAVLPPGFITGLAAGFVALSVAMKLSAAAGLSFSANVGQELRLVIKEVPAGMRASAAAITLFNGALAAAPTVLISLALTALIGLFVRHAQAVAESKARTEEYRATLEKTTGAITIDTRALAAHNLQASGALDAAQQFGIGLATLTDAAVGNQSAINQVNAVLDRYATAQKAAAGAGDENNASSVEGDKAYKTLRDAVSGTNSQITSAVAKQQQLNSATQPTTLAILSQSQAAVNAKRAMEQLATQLLKLAGINLSAAQTDLAFRDSLHSLTQSVQTNGRSLDITTVKGRANRSAVLDSISAALQHADAVGKQTGSQTKAQRAFQNSIPAIEAQARKLGLNKKQVDALVASVGGLKPKTVDVSVVVKGTSLALSGSRVSVATAGGGRAVRQTGFAAGGIMKAFADGAENHVAQVARPGDWRVWAEPETGGEAYIPLASSKRPRSTTILKSVARSFGYGLTAAADGTILNGRGSSTGSIGGSVNSAVNRAALAAATATVAALIKSGRLGQDASSAPFAGGGSVSRWLPVVLSVLAALHQPASASGAVLRRIAFESGGNPNAINLTDSNAKAGHPSQGLVQTIPGTFAAYAGAYASRGITDPFANIYAGMNYALHRYGSIAAVDPLVRHAGYDSGGLLMPGVTMAVNKTGRPERIRTGAQEDRLEAALGRIERLLAGQTTTVQLDSRPIARVVRYQNTRNPNGW